VTPARFEYLAPSTVQDALQMLQQHGDGARLLAGGQSLVPAMNLRLANPAYLIDLNRIPALAALVQNPDGSITAGAMTRHRSFEKSELVQRALPLVHAAMPWIAHTQIRNRGTIGGSLAHGDPAAEWPALCLLLDCRMLVAGPAGEREIAVADFSRGVYETALEPGEILTAIRFPAWPAGRRWGFSEIARRHGDFALAGAACTLDIDDAGVCRAARLVVFGAADRPLLMEAAAATLVGSVPGLPLAAQVADAVRNAVTARADLHASAEYRRDLVGVMTRRALEQALAPVSAADTVDPAMHAANHVGAAQ
jgi:CO/xanthine dehydrogenase FAD-binding subunit